MKNGNIAIDGPVSSGKSTISKLLASKLNKTFISTGAIYRAIAYLTAKNNIDAKNEDAVFNLTQKISISFNRQGNIMVNQTVLDSELRSEEVSRLASIVAVHPKVRHALLDIQQKIAKKGNIIMEGRDIGTVIMPDAEFKIFLNCDYQIRAQRRYDENQARNIKGSLKEIQEAIKKRDHQDITRKVSPLKKAHDAIEVDSSHLNINEVVDHIIKKIG